MIVKIDEMIDMISSSVPDFIDTTKEDHRELYEHVSYLILFSKVLCVRTTLGIKHIDEFTDKFFNLTSDMIEYYDMSMANECYDYVKDFYDSFLIYLEQNEEYEMCSNFTNFFQALEHKTKEMFG